METAILLCLFTKHFIVDFPLQTPFQWMNKGTYGHPGGLLHSGLHGIATILIFLFFTTAPLAIFLGFLDAIIHYHIDYAKMNLNRIKEWKCDKNPEFWTLLGLDQYLHALTYLGLVCIM